MTTRLCMVCQERPGPWGYRLPGPRSALPVEKRGYLFACEKCREAAEARWNKGKGKP